MYKNIIELINLTKIISKKISSVLISEFSLWIILAFVFSWPVWIQVYVEPQRFLFIARDYNLELSFGVIIAILPLAFYQVFGTTPLNYLRNNKSNSGITYNIEVADNSQLTINSKNNTQKVNIQDLEAIEFIYNAYTQSAELASKLYKRAGIYLVFGVLIATGGLIFFSLQKFNISESDQFFTLSIKVLPYVGILFFIELIAFFFLRQYRQAMYEFRYFESIKRTRESQIFAFLSLPADFRNNNPTEFISCLNLYGQHGILNQGQTSEILELEKSNKSELELVTDIINAVKKNS